jgi:hypothetical protein
LFVLSRENAAEAAVEIGKAIPSRNGTNRSADAV